MASSSLSKPRTEAIGPNGSSVSSRLSSGASTTMVGSKKLPELPTRWPPVASVAPRVSASSVIFCIALKPPRIGQRAQRGAAFQAVADLGALGHRDECVDEGLAHVVVHQEARRRDAHLAGVAQLGAAGHLGGLGDVGVGRDDHRRVAAELHRHALHVLAGQRGELLADHRGAGEGDLADHRVRDQVLRDLGRVAVDQVDHAGRHAGIGKGADQFGRRRRRFLGRLDDDRAAGGQCRRTACAPPG